MSATAQNAERQRIDKWLWHARMVRTRGDAAALAEAGYVRINGRRISASSQKVAIGDVVTLALDRSVKVVQVEGFCQRRGQAGSARALYLDLTTRSRAGASASVANSASVAMPPKAQS